MTKNHQYSSYPSKNDLKNSIRIGSIIYILLTIITGTLMTCGYSVKIVLTLSLIMSLCLPTITFLLTRPKLKSKKHKGIDETTIKQLNDSVTLEISPNFYNIQGLIKRIFDFSIALLFLIILLPLFLIVPILIKLDSIGPVFFSQDRLGRDRKEYRIFKFRSMALDDENFTGPVWATENDNRITRVGKFIRRYNLDDLPILINILKGDMSIIGPLPKREFHWQHFEITNNIQNVILSIKPGLFSSGSVISRIRGKNISQTHEYLLDVFYINNWSLVMDIKIIWSILKSFFSNNCEPPNLDKLSKRKTKTKLTTQSTPI
ncbi:MAG: sugar transferase [Desulfobacter sp.]|nr:MAG: sugar transferase [Desulfobacter sp.]